MVKVGLIATHPIQYHIPWYRLLAAEEGIDLTVYYALLPDEGQQGVGFGVSFAWDIPMLEGYRWEVLANTGRSPGLKGFFASSTPGVYRVLAAARPDVVIITGWQSLPLVQALWACVRLRIPRIIRGESNALHERPWWVKSLHRLLLARFDAYLTIGRANRDFYLGYGLAPERIFPCRYFVDNQRFLEQARELRGEREQLRAGWRIPPGAACFLYVGKLEPKKRIMDLLRAMDRAQQCRGDIFLLVVGAGELMDEARSFVDKRGLPATFAGFLNQTEITRAYVAADCLVLPSDFGETWGLVVNEAMVCGLPAVVSDRAGCGPDLVENGVTGAVFACGDIEALTGALLAMAADRERLVSMGKQAQERVRSYSVEAAVEGTLQAIHAATGKACTA